MSISLFDLFKIGIGPSSSHTVGPMRAAARFLLGLEDKQVLQKVRRIQVNLYGSLALTGIGHGTDTALILGLLGEKPDQVDPAGIQEKVESVKKSKLLTLGSSGLSIVFVPKEDIRFNKRKALPYHPNGLRFEAFDQDHNLLHERTYYSVGGGFVVNEHTAAQDQLKMDQRPIRYPFSSAASLLSLCRDTGLSIAQLQRENELAWRSPEELKEGLEKIWATMDACIKRGCEQVGVLPGALKVKRRAAKLFEELKSQPHQGLRDPLVILDWVNLYALAVNEENASGSRVVTAPTNGAAGVIPAVIRYYVDFCPKSDEKSGIEDFLLTAAAVGKLYVENASISGAEVGCQGEVGVACSMAAAGLVAALGGSAMQVEHAAEIGMEHNLGLTCDPIGGLVQIPCIERNAMGAIKAINAARIALRGDGEHSVSLDSVIRTMRQTGADMKTKYKETSRGGLAVNIIEC